MNVNEQLIRQFYTCFKNKDYMGMQACYAPNATFNDPVFKNLDATQAAAMWKMLILKGKDLELTFDGIVADKKSGSVHWVATYTFSVSGRKVVNDITSNFEFEHGKISKHNDDFNFYTWSKQAFGLKGLLLGWTNFMHTKVSRQAAKNLANFMLQNGNIGVA